LPATPSQLFSTDGDGVAGSFDVITDYETLVATEHTSRR